MDCLSVLMFFNVLFFNQFFDKIFNVFQCSKSLQMIPVAANDVALSIHAVLLTAISLFQIMIYEVSRFFCLQGCPILLLMGIIFQFQCSSNLI